MASETHIQWTHGTVNFHTGCRKVSAGCRNCYMFRMMERFHKDPTEVKQVKETTIRNTLRKLKGPSLIFTDSMSDFFIEEADAWRLQAWETIHRHPQHCWQILAKRPERIMQCLPSNWGDGWKQVWMGVSVENQEVGDTRIPILTRVPAHMRFLSVEPMLGPINLKLEAPYLKGKIHWVIVGGESGNETGKYRYRPLHLDWIKEIIAQCKDNGVPVFVKQLGTYLSKQMGLKDRHGGDIIEWPEDIQVREFPVSV